VKYVVKLVTKLWVVRINIDKKCKHIGCFKNKQEAVDVRGKLEESVYGKYKLKGDI